MPRLTYATVAPGTSVAADAEHSSPAASSRRDVQEIAHFHRVGCSTGVRYLSASKWTRMASKDVSLSMESPHFPDTVPVNPTAKSMLPRILEHLL